jgi:hypothetical protein
VHADLVRDLLHPQRLEPGHAALEEPALPVEDRLRDLQERVLPLVHGLDEPPRGLDALLHPLLDPVALLRLPQELAVGGRQREPRDPLALEPHLVVPSDSSTITSGVIVCTRASP